MIWLFSFFVAIAPPVAAYPAKTPASSGESDTAAPDGDVVPIEAIVLRAQGIDEPTLSEALGLRTPERTLAASARDAAQGGRRFAFVDARREADGEVSLSIVVSDGTAYFRTIAASASGGDDSGGDDAGRVRVVATTAANLLAAIDESRVEPDAVDVPLPEPVESDESDESDVTPVKVIKPKSRLPVLPPPASWSLWADAAGGVIVAVGPPSPAGVSGLGGQLSVQLRHRSGAMVTLAGRGAGVAVDGYTVGRARVSAGGGLGRTWGAFDLGIAALLDVEPLWVSRSGTRETIARPDGQQGSTVVLLAGHLRVSTAWSPTIRRAAASPNGRWVRLRMGPIVEVGGGGLSTGGVARLQRPRGDAIGVTDIVRAGGLEVTALLGVGVGLSLPPRR